MKANYQDELKKECPVNLPATTYVPRAFFLSLQPMHICLAMHSALAETGSPCLTLIGPFFGLRIRFPQIRYGLSLIQPKTQ
jgi:hypothetical protein